MSGFEHGREHEAENRVSLERVEKSRNSFSLDPPEGMSPVFLISDLQNCEINTLFGAVLSHQIYGTIFIAAIRN